MSSSAIPVLVVLVALVAAVVAWQAWRRPVARRFAVRDIMRRPGESLLVVAGSLLGTALITGSFIVGDTLDASIKQRIWTQLGPVDEVVSLSDPARAGDAVRRIKATGDESVDDAMVITTAFASVARANLARPAAQVVEIDFPRAESFGGDPDVTGISGPTPGDGEVVLGEELAADVGAEAGDAVTVHLYGQPVELTVDRVLPQVGLAGYWTGQESRSPNAFVAPGTITDAFETYTGAGAAAPSTQVVVSNRGGVDDGAESTGPATQAIRAALVGTGELRVDPIKRNVQDAADEAGEGLGSTFLTFGMFAIVAGILLLVNIFVMLAEERKSQLGMLRAVGTRRSGLLRIFVIEGALYAFAAGVAGVVVGIGVGYAIVTVASSIFASLGDAALDFRFHAGSESLIGGFAIGLLISMATIALTSVRISRVNIIRAIRDLPEPARGPTKARTIIAGGLLAAAAATWFATSLSDDSAWMPALLAPPFVGFGLIPGIGRLIGRRTAVIAASLVALFWGVLGNGILDGRITEAGDLTSFVFQGVLLVFAAVMLLTQLQENLEGFVRRTGARRLSLRLALAYPLARRVRTGLTLGMYSLVIFMLVIIGVLSNAFATQVNSTAAAEAGGFDILVRAGASDPPDEARLSGVDGVERAVAATWGMPLYTVEGVTSEEPWQTTGIDESFVEAGAPALSETAPDLGSEDAVWREVTSNPRAAVVSPEFLQQPGPPQSLVGVGDEISVADPITGRTTSKEVVGILEADESRTGVFMSSAGLEDVLGAGASTSRFYVAVEDGADAEAVAERLDARFVANGVDASTFRAVVEEGLGITMQFIRLIQGYLALGLLVGIAGLGVVMVRAVRDRRREIGVLRALGFVPAMVRRAFVLESAFVAVEGIAVGSVLALVTASQLLAEGNLGSDASFSVPWAQLALICGAAALASLVATARPAHAASRIPPAVALRVGD